MLFTPEEAAEKIRHITAYEIRRRISNGEIEYTAGARGMFLLTEEQIEKFVASLAVPARSPRAAVYPFGRPAPIGSVRARRRA